VNRLLLWVVDRPAIAAALLAGITLVLASQVLRIEVDTSAESFMVEKDPARAFYDEARRRIPNLRIVVVAGHSNTLPGVIQALGGPTGITIDDNEFDRLFALTGAGGSASLVGMRYGPR